MIEIIVVVFLSNKNYRNAKERGKSGGAAIAYTLGLWFGGEILGILFGIAASGGEFTPPVYVAALLFAVGGGVASYFIAKSGTIVAHAQPQPYPAPITQQNQAHLPQQTTPPPAGQQAQPRPPHPHYNDQPHGQPVHLQQQAQSLQAQPYGQPAQSLQQNQSAPLYPSQHMQPPAEPVQTQPQEASATVVFLAKKVMGQFLVSSVTVEINGVAYQAGFGKPLNIMAPAGNVQITCYLNYLGKSGVAQLFVALAPNQTYQLEYKSPMVVTGSGTLNIMQMS